MSALYKVKKEKLTEQAEKEGDRHSTLTKKRLLELEGFSSDLSNLKKRMIFYQNYIGKLKKLVDRDTSENAHLFKGNDEDVILERIAEEE